MGMNVNGKNTRVDNEVFKLSGILYGVNIVADVCMQDGLILLMELTSESSCIPKPRRYNGLSLMKMLVLVHVTVRIPIFW